MKVVITRDIAQVIGADAEGLAKLLLSIGDDNGQTPAVKRILERASRSIMDYKQLVDDLAEDEDRSRRGVKE